MSVLLLWRGVILTLFVSLLGIAGQASAHQFAASQMELEVQDRQLKVSFNLDVATAIDLLPIDRNGDGALDDAEAKLGSQQLLDYLDHKLEFGSGHGEPLTWASCTPGTAEAQVANDAPRIIFERGYRCSGTGPIQALRIKNGSFMEDKGGHIFMAYVSFGGKPKVVTFLPAQQEFQIGPNMAVENRSRAFSPQEETAGAALDTAADSADAPQPAGGLIREYLWQGMLHIWGGIDHVLFVLSLLLVARRWKDLALLVTSFTVAHSITLILGTLEVVPLEQWLGSAFVESTIALSIIYVAVENVWLTRRTQEGPSIRQPQRRVLLTFLFGLIHGFGFSSVLRELGTPYAELVPALLAFNLGVELGQLAVVLPAFPLLLLLARRTKLMLSVVRGGSVLVAVIALFWFFERTFGFAFMPF